MKPKAIISVVVFVAFTIAIGTLLADQGGNGKAKGYPHHGISSPGHPNHYASPHSHHHP